MPAKTIDFMREAMKCAVRAQHHDDVPIGAVVVRDGKVVARGENRVQKKLDPTQHAEIVAIRGACRKLEKKFLDGCEIYVTLEPCAMCAAAISFARIRRLIFAAPDPKGGGVISGARVYDSDAHLWRPVVDRDSVYADTSGKMLKDFFKKLRVKNMARSAEPAKKKAPLTKMIKKRAKTIKKTIRGAKK